jgi:hypothetical protein
MMGAEYYETEDAVGFDIVMIHTKTITIPLYPHWSA